LFLSQSLTIITFPQFLIFNQKCDMIQTEAYFNDIQETLLNELSQAKRSVYVAVAWFTDNKLFELLINKLNEGVNVSVAIFKDDINDNSWNNYERISQNGGQFYAIEGSLMHHKFCVIDERVVITGSYNWTYKAATQNHENIIVTYNDYDLALKFIQQFQNITGQNKKQEQQLDNNRILKRLNIIKNLVLLEDEEILDSQIAKLKAEGHHEIITHVETAIKQRYFSDTIDLINQFVMDNSRITVYQDPMISALRLEMRDLEYRVLAIDNTITEKEKTLRDYTLQFNKYLGKLIEETYRLRNEYHFRNRQESQYSESEYQQAKKEYEEYSQQRENLAKIETYELDEVKQKQLKKLYKKAAIYCHPDRAGTDVQGEATEAFKSLQDAYQRQDLAEVERIFNEVKNGIFNKSDRTNRTLEQLKQKVAILRQKLNRKTQQLQTIEENNSFQTAINTDDWGIYFKNLQDELEDERKQWKEKLAS